LIAFLNAILFAGGVLDARPDSSVDEVIQNLRDLIGSLGNTTSAAVTVNGGANIADGQTTIRTVVNILPGLRPDAGGRPSLKVEDFASPPGGLQDSSIIVLSSSPRPLTTKDDNDGVTATPIPDFLLPSLMMEGDGKSRSTTTSPAVVLSGVTLPAVVSSAATEQVVPQRAGAESGVTQLAVTQPAVTQAAGEDSAARKESAVVDSAFTQQAVTQRAVEESAVTQETLIQPAVGGSAVAQQDNSQKVSSDSTVSLQAVTQPAVSDSAAIQTAVTKSTVMDSAVTQSALVSPFVTTQPAINQSAVIQSAVTQSAVIQSAVTPSAAGASGGENDENMDDLVTSTEKKPGDSLNSETVNADSRVTSVGKNETSVTETSDEEVKIADSLGIQTSSTADSLALLGNARTDSLVTLATADNVVTPGSSVTAVSATPDSQVISASDIESLATSTSATANSTQITANARDGSSPADLAATATSPSPIPSPSSFSTPFTLFSSTQSPAIMSTGVTGMKPSYQSVGGKSGRFGSFDWSFEVSSFFL